MSKPFPPLPDVQLGFYRHFKGAIYLVVGFVFDAEDAAWKVEYFNSEGTKCCRSVQNFTETTLNNVPRFTYIGKDYP